MVYLPQIWEEVKIDLEIKLGKAVYNKWIAPLRLSIGEDQSVNLVAPNTFFRHWAEKYYLKSIRGSFKLRGLNDPSVVNLTAEK